jgi:cellulose synthase (UDP-forming)
MNLKTHSRTTPNQILNTTIIFLFAAPIVILLYASYVFNPAHIENLFMYIIQLIADSISIVVLLSLWLTILLDVVVSPHHRAHNGSFDSLLLKGKPTVDVLIPVAGEPIDIIKKTLRAAINMDYPHNVFVLDDGKSMEVEAIAKKLNVPRITRNTREGAKSGNLNNGIKYSQAEFLAIFDADQVPKKKFITTLLPYMANSEVAMVQSPQHFVNTDYFIASGTSQAQEIFYKYICPAKNISNSAFCVGTNVIYRRKALDEIGGIARVGHSEDIWTSLLLHQKKWQTLFVNEILANGQAPTSISAYFRQQLRWAKGGMSMLFLNNTLFDSNLSLDQRIQYFVSNFYYLVGFSILAYLMFPLAYLLFGVKSLQTLSGMEWLLHYVPYFGLYYSISWLLLGKIYINTISTAIASFYPYLLAFFSIIFGTKLNWTATTTNKKDQVIMKWIWPHVFIVILTIFSFVVGWYNPTNFVATIFNSLWAAINMYLLIIFIKGNNNASLKVTD